MNAQVVFHTQPIKGVRVVQLAPGIKYESARPCLVQLYTHMHVYVYVYADLFWCQHVGMYNKSSHDDTNVLPVRNNFAEHAFTDIRIHTYNMYCMYTNCCGRSGRVTYVCIQGF